MECPFLRQLRQASFQYGRETDRGNSWWWLLESGVRRNTEWPGLFETHVQFEEGPKYPTHLPLLRQCAVGVDKICHWTLEQSRITLHCVWSPWRWLHDPSQTLWFNFWFYLLFMWFLCIFNWNLSFVLLSRCLARIASRDEFVALHGESPITRILGFQPERILSPKILEMSFFVFSNLLTVKVSVIQEPFKIWTHSCHGPYICRCHTSQKKRCIYIPIYTYIHIYIYSYIYICVCIFTFDIHIYRYIYLYTV